MNQELTELQKTKRIEAQNSFLQVISFSVIIFSGLILSEIQIKLFGGLFGGCGLLIGFGLAIYALMACKYTRIALTQMLKKMLQDAIKLLKISALFITLVLISTLLFYWALKTQFVFNTPNGLMRNLHYYYLSPEYIFEHGILLGALIMLTNAIYRGIKKAPEYFKNINNQS
ncbi:MAG: hypothetical protein LUQ18_00360 [Methylococcaceae bacterium]|nr:hypothetical protein [Methylococcaceae bacterium]